VVTSGYAQLDRFIAEKCADFAAAAGEFCKAAGKFSRDMLLQLQL